MRAVRCLVPALLLAACSLEPSEDPQPRVTIEVTPETARLAVGSPIQLFAVVTVDGTASTTRPTWTTSNPAVAAVSSSGLVTGVGEGEATISARYGTVSDAAAISVIGPPAAAIEFATDSIVIPPQWQGVTSVAIRDRLGRDLWSDLNLRALGFRLTSSDTNVVAIREFGATTAFDAGREDRATIFAELNDIVAERRVAVRPLDGVLTFSHDAGTKLARLRMDGSAAESLFGRAADTLRGPKRSLSWAGDLLLFECGSSQPCIFDRRDNSIRRLDQPGLGRDPAWIPGTDRFSFIADGQGVRSYQPSSGQFDDLFETTITIGTTRVSRNGLLAMLCVTDPDDYDSYVTCLQGPRSDGGVDLPGDSCPGMWLAFNDRGSELAAVCRGLATIDIISMVNTVRTTTLRPPSPYLWSVAWDPSDRMLAVGGERLWILARDGSLQMRPQSQEGEAWAVAWEPPTP